MINITADSVTRGLKALVDEKGEELTLLDDGTAVDSPMVSEAP